MQRTAKVVRETAETQISLEISLDGTGVSSVSTGIGFFDHMLALLAKHSLIDLSVRAKGDLEVDAHHTVEDSGICLGKAHRPGARRQSGNPALRQRNRPHGRSARYCRHRLEWSRLLRLASRCARRLLGAFNAALAEEFWRAVSANGAFNLHVVCHYGRNAHHLVEGIFKAAARALRQAIGLDPRNPGIPSTKGIL